MVLRSSLLAIYYSLNSLIDVALQHDISSYLLVAHGCNSRFDPTRHPTLEVCYLSVISVPLLTFFRSHIYGLTKILHWPVLMGQTVVIIPRYELGLFCRCIEQFKVSVVMLVPPIALALVRRVPLTRLAGMGRRLNVRRQARDPQVDEYDMSSLKRIVCGVSSLRDKCSKGLPIRRVSRPRLWVPNWSESLPDALVLASLRHMASVSVGADTLLELCH
jgi:acyl-CoA synthetase (AMP-forming)/AMP-acid ligase II